MLGATAAGAKFPPGVSLKPLSSPSLDAKSSLRTRTKRLRAASTGVERSVVILPGLGNSGADYYDLAEDLNSYGIKAHTVPVARVDWLRNAAGLRYLEYWQGKLSPRPTVDWFLNRLHSLVESVKQETDGQPITLLAHSAGGWLGRLYLKDFGTTGIDRFVSLGSPHRPLPKGTKGAIDQTRGILTYCEENCFGAYHSEVDYVTIAGKFIRGSSLGGEGSISQKLIGLGYMQVCGKSDVWGDGVVPVESAHLEGANNIELDGVYHSPVGAARSAANDGAASEGDRVWYGSQNILSEWVKYLHES